MSSSFHIIYVRALIEGHEELLWSEEELHGKALQSIVEPFKLTSPSRLGPRNTSGEMSHIELARLAFLVIVVLLKSLRTQAIIM